MAWTLRYATSAARAIRKLDPEIRRRVLAAVTKLAQEPERGKPLQMTLKGLRSWRTGDYRIVYRVVENKVEILVVAVSVRVISRQRQSGDRSSPNCSKAPATTGCSASGTARVPASIAPATR